MPRETRDQRTKRLLRESMHINKQAAEQLVKVRAERDLARDQIDDLNVYRDRVENLALKASRLEGYIDRVRETDGKRPAHTVEIPIPIPSHLKHPITAQDIISMSDPEFDNMVANLSKSRLDRMMGRPAYDED